MASPGMGSDLAMSAAIAVTPQTANLLTCTTQAFTATLNGAPTSDVSWSVKSPLASGSIGSIGSIASDGTYSAPLQVPAPEKVIVTATSSADPSLSADATVTLATVHPTAPSPLPSSSATRVDVYSHVLAVTPTKGYAAWVKGDAVNVALSSDGGKTWGNPTNISDPGITGPSCPATAVDPGDPNTAYIVYRLQAARCTTTTSMTQVGATIVLAVTKDGGATFTKKVIGARSSAFYGICPDIVASAPGQIVIVAPNDNTADGVHNPGVDIWTSSMGGDDLDIPGGASCDPTGNVYFHGGTIWRDIAPVHQNTGSTQNDSPTLFTDGKGNTCMLGVRNLTGRAYFQCAPFLGTEQVIDGDVMPAAQSGWPHGAFGPNGQIAIIWSEGYGDYIITSSGIGQPFTPAVILPNWNEVGGVVEGPGSADLRFEGNTLFAATYGPMNFPLVVARSCDGGITWSGSQIVNGALTVDMPFVSAQLYPAGGSMRVLAWAFKGDGSLYSIGLEP